MFYCVDCEKGLKLKGEIVGFNLGESHNRCEGLASY